MALITLPEGAAAATPSAGNVVFYAKADGKLYQKDDVGTESAMGGAGDALVANPLSQFATTTSAQLAGVISDETGSGALVFATSPTLVTPVLGVATATSYNGMTVTTSTGTFTLTNAKTLAVTNTLTLSGTDSTVMTFPPASASVGYLDVPQVSETTSHTFALSDAGKHIYITGTATLTIPTNASVAFPIGTTLTFINNAAAVTTFTTTSLTVYKAGTSAAWASGGTLSIRGMCTFVKVATDTWFVNGTTLS